MTPRFYINIVTIALCLTGAFPSCGQSENKVREHSTRNKSENRIQIDTSKTAIILFDKSGNYAFDNSFKPSTLTQEDIITVDSLLIACVDDYNNSLNKDDRQWRIDFKKRSYKKQLIVVTNKKGEKEVWVNCFCSTWDSGWKTKLIIVDDGGNCYFNFKINLKKKKYYDFSVNGVA